MSLEHATGQVEHLPYELLAEQLAAEEWQRLTQALSPGKILDLLPEILKAAIFDGINTGLGLAGLQEEPGSGSVTDFLSKYLDGNNEGKEDGEQ